MILQICVIIFLMSTSYFLLFYTDVNECDADDDTDDDYSLTSSFFSILSDILSCPPVERPVHNCHNNAVCKNTIGSFQCLCYGDYVGDGVNTCECE